VTRRTGAPTETEAGSHPSFAIKPRHVRALLWLRWKVTLRGYTRSWRRVLGLVIMLIFLLWFAGSAGVGTAFAYTQLSRPAATQVLFGVLGLLYVIWAILPLLQYNLNEGLDVTKLQTYPLTRGEQMVSLLLATLLDLSTLFILALYVGVFVGWRATPLAAAITVVALVVAYIHTVGFSQLMLAALMGLLRSRRYRDLAVIFFAVFGAGFSLFNQLVFARLSRSLRFSDPNAIASIHIDRVLQWTPPGMAARAIALADAGSYAEAIPWLLMPAVLVVVLVVLWSSVLERGITNAETASAPGGRRRRRGVATAPVPDGARPAASGAGRFTAVVPAPQHRWRPISGPSLAIALKDVRYLWRDPQLKGAVLSSLLATAFIFLPNLGSGSSSSLRSGFGGPASVLIAPLPALLVVLVLSINALGLERQGLQTLFLFPVRPLDIFWGKNLVVGGLALALQVLLTIIKAAITGGWEYAPLALCGGIAALLVLLGCGNVTSVITPFRSRSMRMGDTSSFASENGCLRSVVSSTALFCAAVLLSPVAAAIAIPLAMEHSEWLVFTLPAIIVYGVVLHQFTTRLVAPILLRRAPDILAATVREA
jgi:hypothetical protein